MGQYSEFIRTIKNYVLLLTSIETCHNQESLKLEACGTPDWERSSLNKHHQILHLKCLKGKIYE